MVENRGLRNVLGVSEMTSRLGQPQQAVGRPPFIMTKDSFQPLSFFRLTFKNLFFVSTQVKVYAPEIFGHCKEACAGHGKHGMTVCNGTFLVLAF